MKATNQSQFLISKQVALLTRFGSRIPFGYRASFYSRVMASPWSKTFQGDRGREDAHHDNILLKELIAISSVDGFAASNDKVQVDDRVKCAAQHTAAKSKAGREEIDSSLEAKEEER